MQTLSTALNVEKFATGQKRGNTKGRLVSSLYYAFPEELYKKYKDEIHDKTAGIAGIISVFKYDCKVKSKAPKRKEVAPLTDTQIKDFMRIGCMKWFKEW